MIWREPNPFGQFSLFADHCHWYMDLEDETTTTSIIKQIVASPRTAAAISTRLFAVPFQQEMDVAGCSQQKKYSETPGTNRTVEKSPENGDVTVTIE